MFVLMVELIHIANVPLNEVLAWCLSFLLKFLFCFSFRNFRQLLGLLLMSVGVTSLIQ